MAPQQGSQGVAQLVAACRQHLKFRQLASYSVAALAKAMLPPTVGFERNLKEAFEAGALSAVTDVLARHSGDEEVTEAAVSALTAIAMDAEYAPQLVDSGAIMGLLASVLANPRAERGVTGTLLLFEKAAGSAPRALLMAGGIDAATKILEAARGNAKVEGPCVRVLERLVRDPAGVSALLESDGLQEFMALAASVRDEETLDIVFRLLERIARDPVQAAAIKDKHNGLQVLCSSLARLPSDSKLAKSGGRLIAKLASGDVGSLVSRMLSAPASEKEFFASLVASLAMEAEFSEKLLASGSLPALLQVLGTGSPSTSELVARALLRLSMKDVHVEQLISAGAVARIISAMTDSAQHAGLQAASVNLLARIACSSDAALESVDNEGGTEATSRALATHAAAETVATAALSFFETLLTRPGVGVLNPARLEALGCIDAVAAALKAHSGKAAIQLNGTYVLVYSSGGSTPVQRMLAAGAPSAVLANLATPADDAAAKDFKEPSAELIAASMFLSTQFALLDEGKVAIGVDGADVIMAAVSHFTRSIGEVGSSSAIGTVGEVAEQLMMAIVTERQVAEALAKLRSTTDSCADTRSRAEASKLRAITTSVCAFAANASFARILVRKDGMCVIRVRRPRALSPSALDLNTPQFLSPLRPLAARPCST